MSDKQKTRVAFFFGAGVEGHGNFGIETGFDYLQKSLFASITAEENNEICFTEFLSKRWQGLSFFNATYKYSSDTVDALYFLLKNFIKHRCEVDEEFKQKYRAILCTLFSFDDLRKIYGKTFSNEEKQANEDKDTRDSITKEFKHIVTGKLKKHGEIHFDIIKDLFESDKDDKIAIDMNIGVAGSLDSYFHTIIDPKKYGVVKFSKIVNYYWACYFTILRSVLHYLYTHGIEKAKDYLCSPSHESLDYEKVLMNLKDVTNLIYDPKLNYSIDGTYYQHIIDNLKEYNSNLECVGVITTNYYQFCSKIVKNPIYLNGQLKLFECPELLEVVDLTDDHIDTSTFHFPFLFGQSLVKPIINKRQIDEFYELKKVLDAAEVLVVFGFNINEDDNHINSFLHDFVSKKKIIIVTNQKPDEFKAEQKLKCEENRIVYCKVNYGNNSEVVKQIFNTIKSLDN